MEITKLEEELLKVSLEEVEYPKVKELVMRYCMTTLGKELVHDLRPVQDVQWLRNEHERVNEMHTLIMSGEVFPLERTEDISAQLQKCIIPGAFLQSGEILDVLEVLQSSRRLIAFFVRQRDGMAALKSLSNGLYENRLLEKHITEAIDETGTIRDNATKDLQRIRLEIFETSAKLRNRLQKILIKLGEDDLLREEYITQREGRFVVPLKVESKRAIPGLIHGMSSSGSTVFVEPMETFELNNELSLLHGEEQREIVKILSTLTGEIGGVAFDIEKTLATLTLIDVVHAKAQYAGHSGGIKPRIVDENIVELRNIFHPLLLHSKGSKGVIPLSVSFDGKNIRTFNFRTKCRR